MKQYDVVIIGGGLGGLECATILSKEGLNVCLIEKNPVLGGCFQSFHRSGFIIDTGIHYIGSLDEGEILAQYFKYFGILDKIKTRRLDSNAFDIIKYIGNEYPFPIGFQNFTEVLSELFPRERQGIEHYVKGIEEIYQTISVNNLKNGIITSGSVDYFTISASRYIESLVEDPILRNVLAGNVMLYAGDYNHSTFYHHAMIMGSYLAGAYRLVDGSQHVVDVLVETIKANGGTIRAGSEVKTIIEENGKFKGVEIKGGEIIEGNSCISNIHPAVTLELLAPSKSFKNPYRNRIKSLPNSYGIFSVYLIMKKDCYKYQNKNYYYHLGQDVWHSKSPFNDPVVDFAMLSNQATSRSDSYADIVSILTPMDFTRVLEWENTITGRRGSSYNDFKSKMADDLIDFCSKHQPELKENISEVYTSTPLTYRDYTATPGGSAYGILKSCHNPIVSILPVRTKIDNLYFTGQNLNVHGVLGVTLTAILTCSEFLGEEYLAKKIGNI
jgi:phytoene dehydrogenase-like protein